MHASCRPSPLPLPGTCSVRFHRAASKDSIANNPQVRDRKFYPFMRVTEPIAAFAVVMVGVPASLPARHIRRPERVVDDADAFGGIASDR